MKISEEILKKYSIGECSDEEKQLVEEWLQADEEFLVFDEATDSSVSKIQKKLYTSIFNGEASISFKFLKPFIKYSAAACFVLGASTLYFLNNSSADCTTESRIYNESNIVKTQNTSALVFKVFSGSRIEATTNHCELGSVIQADGIVKIKNTNHKSYNLRLKSFSIGSFDINVGLDENDECTLYQSMKGKHYVVINNNPFILPPSEYQRFRRII